MNTVHFVVPDGIDDPARPSGGNTYDRNLCRGLTSMGWSVHEHPVPGFWSGPDAASLAALDAALRRIPDGAVVVVDGLVASPAGDVLVAHAPRLRLVVLVHMPFGHRPTADQADHIRTQERAGLGAAHAVVTTSTWSRRRLMEVYALAPDRVHVAEPGTHPAELADGTGTGERLLSVAAVTADKGHDVLLDALAEISDLPWRCACVGSLDRDREFVDAIRRRSIQDGMADRLLFTGAAVGGDLDRAYADADVMVLASRNETYGMVVTEALARGLPVIAAEVGGVPEALGRGANGIRPGLLVAPGDSTALGSALRDWLGNSELRTRLRQAARERRQSLRPWSTTASIVDAVLRGLRP